MTPSASPPPSEPSLSNRQLSENLDAEISRIRAEIQSLTKRKQLLTSSLLSSTKIQSYLSEQNTSRHPLPIDSTPLQSQAQHNETNIHRLAYGVTSFPFTDPNPDMSDKSLLGIRFDIPSRSGRFEKAPYYIFLRRTDENDPKHSMQDLNDTTHSNHHNLKIHHHTIPALVPLHDYEAKYLPQFPPDATQNRQRGDEGYFSPSSADEQDGEHDNNVGSVPNSERHNRDQPIQDLHALVAAVRHDLTSWHLRADAIALIAEQLNLSDTSSEESSQEYREDKLGRFLLQSLQSTAADARFCRMVWRNGTVGRLRLTDDGHIDRAVVIGEVGDEQRSDRLRDVERILSTGRAGQKLRVVDLPERLKEVAKWMDQRIRAQDNVNGHHDSMEIDDPDVEGRIGVQV